MSVKEENIEKFDKFAEFCKNFYNIRTSPSDFLTKMKEEFSMSDIEMFMVYLAEIMGKNIKEFHNSIAEYIFSIISEDPSILFSNIDLNNIDLVTGSRKIIEMNKVESFDLLPIYSKKSADSALNALIAVLMNDNKIEMKKDVLKLASSPYFSILISSGSLFSPEKYKQARILFKEKDPFFCPFYQIPITQLHLPMSLFSGLVIEQFFENDKYKILFFLFAVYQQIIFNSSHIKFFMSDLILSSIFSNSLNFYLTNPSYISSFYLNSFLKKDFTDSDKFIKINDFYSFSNEDEDESFFDSDFFNIKNQSFYSNQRRSSNHSLNLKVDKKNILQYFYDDYNGIFKQISIYNSQIINKQLPNGILPTYESASNFLTSVPEKINMDTIIEDSLHYPSFTSEIANIFMSKLIEKDYETVVKLSIQVLKKIDDIKITWISQHVFYPIMRKLYECLKEINDENQFEVLFYLFISFYEGCSKQGDEEINESLKKFISTIDEPFRVFLENFDISSSDIYICENTENNDETPLNKLINFFKQCKETNDIDVDLIQKYPYLFVCAYLWGIKTFHPNSSKLLTIKFPKYKILKRFFVLLSSFLKNKSELKYSNFIYTVSPSDLSYELLNRFPPYDESGIKLIVLHNLQQYSSYKISINQIQGIVISWRAWMKIFSIEKFTLIILEAIILANEQKLDQIKSRTEFLFAERILASAFLSPIKTNLCFSSEDEIEFNLEKKKFEKKNVSEIAKGKYKNVKADKAFKSIIWTTLEFVNNYQGFFSEGAGIASFCLLFIISIENNWKDEFKKVLDFCMTMLKDSAWKSLKYSFVTNFLYLSLSILEIHDLIKIDMFDRDFLKINWGFGIEFFFIQSEIKHLKESKLYPQK